MAPPESAPARPMKIVAGADEFGRSLLDALIAQLRSLNIEVEDIGTTKYYSVGEEIGRLVSQAATAANSAVETRGLLACGTGVGVAVFANKFPGVYATTCLTTAEALNNRSINNCNVLAVSGMSTSPETASEILTTFLNTPFKSPCPASGSKPWPEKMQTFFDESLKEMPKIGNQNAITPDPPCLICSLAKSRVDKEFTPVDIMPGGSMKILRETPTSAIVRFKAGSVELAHHHTFGHDLVVTKGSKRVWNLSKGEKFDLGVGDYLFTPAGEVHRVKYSEDTEFFIKWDGHWDLFLDEDVATANAAIAEEKA